MRTDVVYAVRAVEDLDRTVGQLAACLQQGVERPTRPPSLDLAVRLARREADHAERLERVDIAPGEAPAPLDLEVMDELVEIFAAVESVTGDVLIALGLPRPMPLTTAFADPRPMLSMLRTQLRELTDAALVRRVELLVKTLIERAEDVLGLATDGQVLKALCPWCKGRTEAKPTGGEHTLRVRDVRGIDSAAVICEGGTCEPPESDVGTWVRGNPAWLPHEWDWLADRINRTAAAAS